MNMVFRRATVLTFTALMVLGASSNGYAEDKYPTPPAPKGFSKEVQEKAGLGTGLTYAEAGVLELGGSLGYINANKFVQFNVSPSIGWFFADNFQISGIISFNYSSLGSENATYWTALAEPSFHVPFTKTVFGFLGMGVGPAYSDIAGTGLALVPRIGSNVLVGRSGVLTPALFLAYNTLGAIPVSSTGTQTLEIDSLLGINVSYTALW